jgi:5-methyltetrahydropteroyltriglutamate--homocysteine methyltransferase
MTFGLHLCRGNPADGGFHRQGAYDEIAELLFTTTRHQRLLLEYDTERAGSFEPLRFLPSGKTAVLGLVSTKIPDVERVDDLKRRIEAAAKYAPLEQLAISPQCGFASGIGHRRLTRDQQFRKLEVLLETAAQVWG